MANELKMVFGSSTTVISLAAGAGTQGSPSVPSFDGTISAYDAQMIRTA